MKYQAERDSWPRLITKTIIYVHVFKFACM